MQLHRTSVTIVNLRKEDIQYDVTSISNAFVIVLVFETSRLTLELRESRFYYKSLNYKDI